MEPYLQIGKFGCGEMVIFPPLAPSVGWWNKFFTSLSEKKGVEAAITEANKEISSTKDFTRLKLLSQSGDLRILSAAIQGGNRQLKNLTGSEEIMLSNHAEWRKTHPGAFEAVLGKTPFYRYFEDKLLDIYSDPSIISLAEFNAAIFNMFFSLILGNINLDNISLLSSREVCKKRGEEIAESINKEVSILYYYALYGPEVLLGVLSLR